MQRQDILIVERENYGRSNRWAYEQICSMVGERLRISQESELRKEQFLGKKYVIAIGGDGTALSTARFITDPNTYFIGINPDGRSVGELMQFTDPTIGKLERVLLGDDITGCVEKKDRAMVTAGEGLVPLDRFALNEVYIGVNLAGRNAVRYLIRHKGKQERQMSSGIIIATPVGSTGLYHSETWSSFRDENHVLKFRVTQPYFNDSKGILLPEIVDGTIKAGECLEIISRQEQRGNFTLNMDGIPVKDIEDNERIQVSLSQSPLNIIVPEN